MVLRNEAEKTLRGIEHSLSNSIFSSEWGAVACELFFIFTLGTFTTCSFPPSLSQRKVWSHCKSSSLPVLQPAAAQPRAVTPQTAQGEAGSRRGQATVREVPHQQHTMLTLQLTRALQKQPDLGSGYLWTLPIAPTK